MDVKWWILFSYRFKVGFIFVWMVQTAKLLSIAGCRNNCCAQIDRLNEWQTNPHTDVATTISKQKASTTLHFNDRVKQVVVEFAELVGQLLVYFSYIYYFTCILSYKGFYELCVVIRGAGMMAYRIKMICKIWCTPCIFCGKYCPFYLTRCPFCAKFHTDRYTACFDLFCHSSLHLNNILWFLCQCLNPKYAFVVLLSVFFVKYHKSTC